MSAMRQSGTNYLAARIRRIFPAYLWGFPVAQVLAFAGLNSLGLVPFALLSILCTLPFAAVSWFLVERRFIKRHAAAKGANVKS